jgi:hypothetical protein
MVIKRGLVIGTAAEQGLLVDEVGVDSELADHPDVIWYPSNDALSAMFHSDWYGAEILRAPQYRYVHGWEGAASSPPGSQAIVAATEFGMNAVRWGSQYQSSPDHIDDYATIQSWNKYVNSNDPGKPSAATAIGSTYLTQAYYRWMIMVESDVAAGFNEQGMKLSGLNHFEEHYCIFWYGPPSGGRAQLYRYMHSDSHGDEQGSTSGPMDVASYLYLDQWHALEMFYKVNTDASTSDGELEMYLDDVLIFSRTGIKWSDTNRFVIGDVRGQLYHGGTGSAPITQIHHRQFGFCLANRRIGRANTV